MKLRAATLKLLTATTRNIEPKTGGILENGKHAYSRSSSAEYVSLPRLTSFPSDEADDLDQITRTKAACVLMISVDVEKSSKSRFVARNERKTYRSVVTWIWLTDRSQMTKDPTGWVVSAFCGYLLASLVIRHNGPLS